MKKIGLLLITGLFTATLAAQTMSPEVYATSGGYYEQPNGSMSVTIGEGITETLYSGGYFFLQGFQQPDDTLLFPPTYHCGVINTDETWLAVDNPHIVDCNVTVASGATLTISDGCIVKFEQGHYLQVNGTLDATGSSGAGITFTRNGSAQWYGIRFQSGSTGTMKYCTVEYSTYSASFGIYADAPDSLVIDNCTLQNNDFGFYGSNANPVLTNNYFQNNPTSVYFTNTTSPEVGSGNILQGHTIGIHFDNCSSPVLPGGLTVENNTECGIYYQDCSSIGTIDNLNMDNNGDFGAFRFHNSGYFTLGNNITYMGNDWPVSVNIGSFAAQVSHIPVSGNINNAIRVYGGGAAGTGTWHLFNGIDYIVTGNPTLSAGGNLTIEPGNTIRFEQGHYLQVYGDLDATGFSGAGITFTRNGSAQWYGIRFQSGSTGIMKYCTIEYCTYGSSYGIYANVPDSLVIDHCALQNNDIGFYGSNANPVLTNNYFQNNPTSVYFANTTSPEVGSGNILQGHTIGIHFDNCSSPVLPGGLTVENNTECGIYYQDCSSIGTIDNLNMNNNGDFGAFRFHNSGYFTLGNNITYSGNDWPLSINLGSFPTSVSYIPVSGNINNNIRVYGGVATATGTWHLFTGIDYIVTGNATLSAGGSLAIEDGNTIRFNQGRYLQFNGTLDATGTSGAGITFTRNGSAQWYGIRFQSGSTGIVKYCTVEYSTYSASFGIYADAPDSLVIDNCTLQNNDFGFYGSNANPVLTNNYFQNNPTSVYFTNTTSPEVGSGNILQGHTIGIHFDNCSSPVLPGGLTVENNTECGIYYQDCSSIGTIDNLNMNNNGDFGAFRFHNSGYFTLGNNITYSGNNWPVSVNIGSFAAQVSHIPASGNVNNAIRVYGGGAAGTGTWHLFSGIDYIVTGNPTLSAGGNLTIEAGNTIRFEQGHYLQINGILNATGSSGAGITFTRNGSAQWYGIRFENGSTGTMNYCTVEYSTYSSSYGIYANSPVSLLIDNCILQNNDYGFYGNNCSPEFTYNNQIINNLADGIHLTGNCNPVFGSDTTQRNDIYGNAGYNINNDTPNDIYAQYVYWGANDSTQIASTIYDYYDNNLLGIVHFAPWISDSPFIALDITLFLQGPFMGSVMNTNLNSSGYIPLSQPYNQAPWNYPGAESVAAIPNADVVDWILVELRDASDASSATSATIVAQQAAFLLKNGATVSIDGSSLPLFTYSPVNSLFAVIWHRNSIGIMSAVPLTDNGGIYFYDFTTGSGQAYGGINAHKEIAPGIWGMIGADGNADGQVNNGDKNDVWSPQAGTGGYLGGDFNLDAQVNNGDKNDIWVPNTGLGGQVPD